MALVAPNLRLPLSAATGLIFRGRPWLTLAAPAGVHVAGTLLAASRVASHGLLGYDARDAFALALSGRYFLGLDVVSGEKAWGQRAPRFG